MHRHCALADPTKPGERVKTDRRDARKLAFNHAKGMLTEVRPPSEKSEALREFCRTRDTAKKAEKKAKQQLLAFLLRQGRQHTFKSTWTKMHVAWLERQKFSSPHLQLAFDYLLQSVTHAIDMTTRVEASIEAAAQDPTVQPMVKALMCLKGVRATTAMVLISELHGFERFRTVRQLMAFLDWFRASTAAAPILNGPVSQRQATAEFDAFLWRRPGTTCGRSTPAIAFASVERRGLYGRPPSLAERKTGSTDAIGCSPIGAKRRPRPQPPSRESSSDLFGTS